MMGATLAPRFWSLAPVVVAPSGSVTIFMCDPNIYVQLFVSNVVCVYAAVSCANTLGRSCSCSMLPVLCTALQRAVGSIRKRTLAAESSATSESLRRASELRIPRLKRASLARLAMKSDDLDLQPSVTACASRTLKSDSTRGGDILVTGRAGPKARTRVWQEATSAVAEK